MSTNTRPTSAAANGSRDQGQPMTYFEEQREMLLNEISQSMEHVLQNINRLNRSLEGVIAVGNEFSSVEALWSQFENVMARDPNPDEQQASGASGSKHEAKEEDQTEAGAEEGDEY